MKGISFIFSTILFANSTIAHCPWQKDVPDLQSSCLCAYNLGHELSVQCDQVNFSLLLDALNKFSSSTPIDLLFINNSTIEKLESDAFNNLKIYNVQLSSCNLKHIEDNAFRGQEKVLKNLNLQDNFLEDVPYKALNELSTLNLLDLSKNQISYIVENSFRGLTNLSTLKLNDNNITLNDGAFKGLENSLKNLNLKGTRQKYVPNCVRQLKLLAFLDLSQNLIQELPGSSGVRTFEGLEALTALNLERNLIQNLGETSFAGVRKTLTSLSLLNNLLSEFPVGAIHSLKELRVLDIGFNLLTTMPETAFRGNPSITLLALDGNPLTTVPEKALKHLNNTLRGLSLGGRFLHCDCKLKWVAEWIRNGDLQVTSRERNPQFCGSPNRFRDRGFYSIQPEEFICPTTQLDVNGPFKPIDSLLPKPISSTPASIRSTTYIQSIPHSTTHLTNVTASSTMNSTLSVPITILPTTELPTPTLFTTNHTTNNYISTTKMPKIQNKNTFNWRQNSQVKQRPNLVLGYPLDRGTSRDIDDEVQVKSAFRQDNTVTIQWESAAANILGFRVVYRLFADNVFKQGPPLEASEREFKIKNVPPQECIIVCVISLEDTNVTPDNVLYSQCREVRTAPLTSNIDKVTIAASAAICGTIIVAVIVFISASRRRRKKLELLSQQKPRLPISALPVNCCVPTSSPGPIGSTLSAFNHHKEWDQVSAYSGRSIPRPRVYSVENQNIAEDLRSHISHFSGVVSKVGKARSIADGQSQHSYSNYSHRGYLNSAFPSNLVNSRQELRQSRQSLTTASERMSHGSYAPSVHGPLGHPSGSSIKKTRPRSRSRDQLSGIHIHPNRPGSRYSTSGSTRTLNNYCDTSDNWTDHDMDIYMTRNATARNGLVPL